jgi:hypothetical protein
MATYPYVSISKAIDLAQKIYQVEQLRPATKDSLAATIGYGSLNGSSESALSTLVDYGMLEELEDRQLRITPLCVDILFNNPQSPKRIAAIAEAVARIDIFEEFKAEFGERLVPEHVLASYLQEKKGVRGRTALRTARVYRATMEHINRGTQSEQAHISGGLRGSGMQNQEDMAITRDSSAPRILYIPLDESNDIRVVFPDQKMTVKRLNRLIKHLRFVRDSMKADDSTDEDETPMQD